MHAARVVDPRSIGGRLRALALLLVLAAALAAASAAAGDDFAVTRSAFTGGGSEVAAGPYTLTGNLGEAIVGGSTNTDPSLGGGFWAPAVSRTEYLPMVRR